MDTVTPQKPLPEIGFRRMDSFVPLAGRNAVNGLALQQRSVAQPEVKPENLDSHFNPHPVNRYYGFFPISKATAESNKTWVRALANNDFYNTVLDGVKVNDQEQKTQFAVMGSNFTARVTQANKNPNYAGNVEGGHSNVFHARKSTLSNLSRQLAKQFEDVSTNPQVKINTKKNDLYNNFFGGK